MTFITNMTVTSTGSGSVQVFNSLVTPHEYEPDRSISPTTVVPQVFSNVTDGSAPVGTLNKYLTGIQWYVNNIPINQAWSLSEYGIVLTDTDNKGTLTILKNTPPGERLELTFTATYSDTRFGINIPIEFDGVILETVEKSMDKYEISMGGPNSIIYNPFDDRLLQYDAAVAAGDIKNPTPALAATYTDSCSYLKSIPFTVYRGTSALTQAQLGSPDLGTLEFRKKSCIGNDTKSWLGTGTIEMDLRYIESAEYELAYIVGGIEVSTQLISVSRRYPFYEVEILSPENIPDGMTKIPARAIVTYAGNKVPYPLSLISITWYTESYRSDMTTSKVLQGTGTDIEITISSVGLGNTSRTAAAELYVETDYVGIKN